MRRRAISDMAATAAQIEHLCVWMRTGDHLDPVEIGAASMRGAGNIGVRARTELAVDDVIMGLHGAPRSKPDE
jgi:hypothetical protein